MPTIPYARVLFVCLGLLLQAPAAHAQASSNTSLNAQLLVAARQSDLAAVQQALARGAAPDSRNRLGKTVLMLAAEKGHAAMASAALVAGTDPNLASLDRVTPLMAASFGGSLDIVQALLVAGARTDSTDRMQKPAIVYAAGRATLAWCSCCWMPAWRPTSLTSTS